MDVSRRLRAGYMGLPSNENRSRFVIWQAVAAPAVLLVVGLIPTISHLSGLANFEGALAIGAIFLHYSARFALQKVRRRRAAFTSCFHSLSPDAVCIARAGQEL